MKTVRFTSFSYTMGEDPNAPIEVKMTGQAVGYRDVALQSDLFAQDKHFIEPVISHLTLDQKANVLFNLDFSVAPSFLKYKNSVARSEQ